MKDSSSDVSRRQFLAGAGTLGTALVLGQTGFAQTEGAKTTQVANAPEAAKEALNSPQLVLKLNDNPELGKVGGWKIFEWNGSSVIVANTDTGFVACSAICTHKGCEVNYDHSQKQFACPCHRARFDLEGNVVRGPAKLPLQKFDAATALVVSQSATSSPAAPAAATPPAATPPGANSLPKASKPTEAK